MSSTSRPHKADTIDGKHQSISINQISSIQKRELNGKKIILIV